MARIPADESDACAVNADRKGGVAVSAGLAGLPGPVESFRLNIWQLARDKAGQQDVCAACGHDGSEADPLVIAADGYRVHLSHHIAETDSGFYGTPFTKAAA